MMHRQKNHRLFCGSIACQKTNIFIFRRLVRLFLSCFDKIKSTIAFPESRKPIFYFSEILAFFLQKTDIQYISK
ncbi:hypothetical protein D1164_19580 [Mariniphaga sediminis]|uniref:Uncharacterized protein n=1 Tax=Mariniphaga sediminis TaxID=1628158 RepID=A0A399CV32_9BACT|nr:hypothetical protein D1164_19580 [Mariniphaga sediminis]